MKIKIIKNKDIKDYSAWPIWSCGVSKFDWEYADEEHCFIIEGKVTVVTSDGSINIGPGDYVVFPKGLKCKWDVHNSIKKHYTFK